MIQSMTGYAAASADTARGALNIELRSVNARFLDVQFRVWEELRALEPMLRELIGGRVSRGKLDCRFFLNRAVVAPGARIKADALARLNQLSAEVAKAMPQATPLRVADVLRWPGVIAESPLDEEETRRVATALCRKALDELVDSRRREGAKLATAVGERVAAMRARLEQAAPLVPQALAAYQAKLTERLREAIGSADEERVRTEIVVFATKMDVDEELTRLRAHLDEAERTLKKSGAAGERLHFIAQEV